MLARTDACPTATAGRRAFASGLHGRQSATVLTGLWMCMILAGARAAGAQAWGPAPGEGAVSLTSQVIQNTGHRLTDGFLIPDGKSTNAGLAVDVDYGLTPHWSFSAGLPFVFSKYIGPNPPPFSYPEVDACHCWQHGAQDVGLTARYALVNGGFALTPSISAGVPSHDYNYRGEAVVGQNLREIRLGVDSGLRLDRLWDRLVVEGRYSYAFVERALDIRHDRSNAAIEGAVLVGRRASVRGIVSWQHTHGGLRSGSPMLATLPFPGDINTPDRIAEHDRLLRDDSWHVGAGASYGFDRVDVFGSYIEFVSGTDTHAGRAFTMGVSVPFTLPRASRP
jgi:hypothetical protein